MHEQFQPDLEAGDDQSQPQLIWGAKALAREFNLTPRQFYHLAAKKLLPGVEQVGRKYVGNRRRIGQIGE